MLAAVGSLGGLLMMQASATPPMKMGLWESTSTMTMKFPGMETMPTAAAAIASRTTTVRKCLTPENYAGSFDTQQQSDCTRSHEVFSSKGYSFDVSCSRGKTAGHFQMTFESAEEGHGTSHMTIETPRSSGTMDTVMTTRFVSSDCGAVMPDKPVVAH